MRATAFAANTSASSVAKQFHRVLLLWALVVTASLTSWAQIAVSPASLTFAKQLIDTTSTSKPVTITNNGASAQAVNFVMSGDYTQSNNCSGSIAGGGGSCTAKISFTPTLIGSIKGAASIYDNSKNLLAFVGLTGTGGAPVTTTPTSLSFTGGTIGTTSAAKTFKIANNTTGTVTINSITTNVSDYTIATGTCLTTPLAKAGSCTVTVTVTPTSAVDDGAIIITDNAPNALPLAVKLTSAATAGASPVSLSKTSLIFKTLSGTTSAAQTITVTNTSGNAVALGTITASADYAIVSNLCTSSLAAAAKCTFGITFNPTFIGAIEGSVAIQVNSPNIDSPQLVNLAGTSLAPLTVAPASLTFTAQAVGTTSAAKAVKITNNNTSAVTLSGIVPSGDFGIQLSGTTCSLTGGTLAAGKVCTLEIQFSPTIAGSIVGALTVTNTASPNPLLVPLSGTGTATNNTLLKGNYAMMLNGWDSATTLTAVVGSFVADGAGNISSGLIDLNFRGGPNGPTSGTFTGTYSVGSNNLATINLTYGGGLSGSDTFEAALDASDGNGHIIFYDSSNFKASGLLRKQDASAFSTSKITGNYAFGLVGVNSTGGSRQTMAGEFNSDGNGNITGGEIDFNDASSAPGNAPLSASTFSVASTGRGTGALTVTGHTLNFVFYVVSATELLFMDDGSVNDPLVVGQVLQQSGTFTDASLNGISVIEIEALDNNNSPATGDASAGLLTTNGSGSFSVALDENDGGTMSSQSDSGTYSVSSNGRVPLTGGSGNPPVLYLIGKNQAFLVGTDDRVSFGVMEPQTGSNFTNASLSGIYLCGSQQPVSMNVGEEVDYLNADGAGNFTGTGDTNGSGGPSSGSNSGTYVVSSNGRVTRNGHTGIDYIISTSQFVHLPGASHTNPALSDCHQ